MLDTILSNERNRKIYERSQNLRQRFPMSDRKNTFAPDGCKSNCFSGKREGEGGT